MLLDVVTCSFKVIVTPAMPVTPVFGSTGLEIGGRLSITRLVMSLEPETLGTPATHVAMELAMTKSADILRPSVGRVRVIVSVVA